MKPLKPIKAGSYEGSEVGLMTSLNFEGAWPEDEFILVNVPHFAGEPDTAAIWVYAIDTSRLGDWEDVQAVAVVHEWWRTSDGLDPHAREYPDL